MTDKTDHPNHMRLFWKCWLLVGYSRVDSGGIHLIHVLISLIQNLGNVNCEIACTVWSVERQFWMVILSSGRHTSSNIILISITIHPWVIKWPPIWPGNSSIEIDQLKNFLHVDLSHYGETWNWKLGLLVNQCTNGSKILWVYCFL